MTWCSLLTILAEGLVFYGQKGRLPLLDLLYKSNNSFAVLSFSCATPCLLCHHLLCPFYAPNMSLNFLLVRHNGHDAI